jgi:hypothetical protein
MLDNSDTPTNQTDPAFRGRDPGLFGGDNEPGSRWTTLHASPLNLRWMIVIVPNNQRFAKRCAALATK